MLSPVSSALDAARNMYDCLKDKYNWRPIGNCPGRYVLAEGVISKSICQLVGKEVHITEETFENAQDPVSYCFFEGGGLISYSKQDGYLHTLCDESGMKRKLGMLKAKTPNQ